MALKKQFENCEILVVLLTAPKRIHAIRIASGARSDDTPNTMKGMMMRINTEKTDQALDIKKENDNMRGYIEIANATISRLQTEMDELMRFYSDPRGMDNKYGAASHTVYMKEPGGQIRVVREESMDEEIDRLKSKVKELEGILGI